MHFTYQHAQRAQRTKSRFKFFFQKKLLIIEVEATSAQSSSQKHFDGGPLDPRNLS